MSFTTPRLRADPAQQARGQQAPRRHQARATRGYDRCVLGRLIHEYERAAGQPVRIDAEMVAVL
jgi:hypothetical protein